MIDVKFTSSKNSFNPSFEKVNDVSDGGYERGLAEGYENGKNDGLSEGYIKGEAKGFADALARRTDLVVTENGEYTPEGESTGFKSVSVEIKSKNKFMQIVEKTITELTANDLQGATKIGSYAFRECQSLLSVEIPEGVSNISDYSFYKCQKLKSVKFADSVAEIGQYCFFMCDVLNELTFGENSKLTKIGSNAFYGISSNIEEITIPKLVTDIGNGAFGYCYYVKRIIVKAKIPPTIQASTFNLMSNDHQIIVPIGCGEVYRQATNWSIFADFIVEGDV